MVPLADIVRAVGPSYLAKYGPRMLPSHLRALDDILRCRTPALGGSVYHCDACGHLEYSYHSCRNRHCPKCQGDRARQWCDGTERLLLPGRYFHITFTAPSELRETARSDQRPVYGILIREAIATVLALTGDPKYLGARPGIVAVLHTWTGDLAYHPHVHLLVTAGGMRGPSWYFPTHRRFLFPGRVASPIYRAKVRDALQAEGLLPRIPPDAWRKKWVVHLKDAGSGREVARYLSRYIFRVAITENRILSFRDGQVTFSYKDRPGRRRRTLTLPAEEFLARFLQHVLPKRFVKVRRAGIFAPACKDELAHARRILENVPLPESRRPRPRAEDRPDPPTDEASENRPDQGRLCPKCGKGRLVLLKTLPRKRGPP